MLSQIGRAKTVEVLDELKKNGFAYATKSGFSVATDDMIIPDEKKEFIDEAMAEVDEVRSQYKNGVITNNERYNKIIDIWTHCNSQVAQEAFPNYRTRITVKTRLTPYSR